MMSTTPAERRAVIDSRYPIWPVRALGDWLRAIAEEYPDSPFVVTDTCVLTYRQVSEQAHVIAHNLRAKGLQAGDRIGLLMANHPEFVALKFGIALAGAICVPINYLNRQAELAYVLRQSECEYLVAMSNYRDLDYVAMLSGIAKDREVVNHLKYVWLRDYTGPLIDFASAPLTELFTRSAPDESGSTPLPIVSGSACSDIIYTSGTTGGPKGVMLTHDQLARAAFSSAYGRAFETGRRVLFALPMYHVYGYVEGLLAALFVGGSIVPRVQFDAHDMLRAAKILGANDILLVPTMTLALLDVLEERPLRLPELRGMLSSGGKAPPNIWDRIDDAFGDIEVTTGYGMTEATASTTVTLPEDPAIKRRTTNGKLRNAGVAADPALGRLLVEYRVVDPNTEELLEFPAIGELRMRGMGVTQGYFNKHEETLAAFDANGWLKTGDLGVIDHDGYITLVGRIKESYRCGGELVLPADAETVLLLQEGVDEAFVVPVPDDRMGEIGVAYVVGRGSLDSDHLQTQCRMQLARFKVPKYIWQVPSEFIPRTPTGRPRKFLLLADAAARAAQEVNT
jgi:fatty-acyl-CoA synthase